MSIKKAWEATAGYKTITSGILITMFEFYQLVFPELLPDRWENWIYKAIAVVGATGILDKLIRLKKTN